SAEKWGGITRKISFGDRDPVSSPVFELVDGSSVDQQEVRKPDVLETRYVGSDIFQGHITVFRDQLDLRFSSAAELARFMSGLMTNFSNQKEQWLEELARNTLANFIGAKNIVNSGAGMVHLLTEYNALTGLSLTATTVRQPSNWPAFIRWVYARIDQISKKMTERSQLFQAPITGKKIFRHTPVEDQKVYILDEFLSSIKAEVLSTTYNDSYLQLADTEAVGYWQDILEPDVVDVTPAYMDADGTVKTGAEQDLSKVIGVIFDRDAVGYNIYMDTIDASPFNAKGLYYNLFQNCRVMYTNDLTEKGVVLCLD
ncbi:MAG: hypothetical protein II414_01250, partial [Erysipelotrichaceae bacterium]|nr:hypothetical protein [Erysipelotrichaceae bacterium]